MKYIHACSSTSIHLCSLPYSLSLSLFHTQWEGCECKWDWSTWALCRNALISWCWVAGTQHNEETLKLIHSEEGSVTPAHFLEVRRLILYTPLSCSISSHLCILHSCNMLTSVYLVCSLGQNLQWWIDNSCGFCILTEFQFWVTRFLFCM